MIIASFYHGISPSATLAIGGSSGHRPSFRLSRTDSVGNQANNSAHQRCISSHGPSNHLWLVPFVLSNIIVIANVFPA
jgi:hypothetical protein